MKVAYLLNTYPVPSGTFIRGEIEALEAIGVEVTRMAVRRFDGALVDPSDIRDSERTTYLLDGNQVGLVGSLLREILVNPVRLAKTLPMWWRLQRRSKAGLVRHIAYLMQAASFRQTAEKHALGHVHSHFSNNATGVAMLAKALGGPNYSFTAHGPDEFLEAEEVSTDTKIAHASFVVAISEFCRRTLISISNQDADADKIHILRCGLDLTKFDVAPPASADNHTLVCVGRLCPQKGQVHIPEAVAALRDTFHTLKVILVGDGESRALVEAEIARHGVAEQVILHGWGTNQEVRRMVTESRALLLPSYAEGLPIVIMEALALGRPVISTTIAGIPELVDSECGWLVEPGNVGQLQAAIAEALTADHERLRQLGETGRRRVEAMHDRRQLALCLKQLFAVSLSAKPRDADLVPEPISERRPAA